MKPQVDPLFFQATILHIPVGLILPFSELTISQVFCLKDPAQL